jgi:hypothetical protein
MVEQDRAWSLKPLLESVVVIRAQLATGYRLVR